MLSAEQTCIAVTVTYGDRSDLCIRVVKAALSNGCARVVVVANGPTATSLWAIRSAFEGADDKVTLIEFDRNLGTAKGFGRGIKAALQEGSPDFVWLLDDDNLVGPTGLKSALATVRAFHSTEAASPTRESQTPPPVVSCFRESDENHLRMQSGVGARRAYLPAGGFFGFDLLERIGHRRLRTSRLAEADRDALVPQASYGGLLLPAEVIRSVGLPDEAFVLYYDDVEYTRRIRAAGFPIVVSFDSIIEDISEKWVDSSSRYLDGMIKARNEVRTYYTVRNSFVVDRRAAMADRRLLRFIVNFSIYSMYVAVTSMKNRDHRFARLYWRACLDGARGRMGERIALA